MGRATDEIARFVGTGAYTGYAPVASGTFGTLPAVALAVPLAGVALSNPPLYVALLVASVLIAVWSADRCVALFASKDPSRVVSDEIAGFFLAMAWLPPTWPVLLVAFLFFRLFDIVKPSPAREAEGLPGGWGVVADDLIAGVYANLALRLLDFVTGNALLGP